MVDKTIHKGHVYYFEPNDGDIGVDQDGMSVGLTPHTEDMCISMSLYADVYPRVKTQTVNKNEPRQQDRTQRQLSWVSYVTSGTEMGNDRFLTTYYTEISADKYVENELVEGLGITGINISFESWYTPTITINFVDVHGSSLWGREEAIHDNGEITAGNVLGIFFSIPYPLFRLQVKGFLGKAVTYQLSVSNFKGRYNAQTGNFEATVTFIGYSYSLLTDIPLKLLSAISEDKFYGKEYWNQKVGLPEWRLENSDHTFCQPVPLYKLIQSIKSAIGTLSGVSTQNCNGEKEKIETTGTDNTVISSVEKDQIVSNTAAGQVTSTTVDNSELNAIKVCLNNFLSECKVVCETVSGGKFYIGNGGKSGEEEQMVWLLGNGKNEVSVTPKFISSYLELHNSIEKYNSSHPNEKIDNTIKGNDNYNFSSKIINGAQNMKLTGTKIFHISTVIVTQKEKQIKTYKKVVPLKGVDFNNLKINGTQIFDSISKQIKKDYDLYNVGQKSMAVSKKPSFGTHALRFNIGKIKSLLDTQSQANNITANNVETVTENKIAEQSNSTETIDAQALQKKFSEEFSQLSQKVKDDEEIVLSKKYKISQLVGFEPTIGNFVKLVMCHLETFVATMMECVREIHSQKDVGKRSLEALGLSGFKDTDIPDAIYGGKSMSDGTKNQWVFPFPELHMPEKTNSETNGSGRQVLCSPLDYVPMNGCKWSEGELVLSLMEASSRTDESIQTQNSNEQKKIYNVGFPLFGADLNSDYPPFSNVASSCNDIGELSAYLGLRMASVIGLGDKNCDVSIAEAMGIADAINYVQSCTNVVRLKNIINVTEGKQKFSDRVTDYLTCNENSADSITTETGVKYNIFETSNTGSYYHKTRHPMFVKEDNDMYIYSYAYANKNKQTDEIVSIIPSQILKFEKNNNPYVKTLNPSVTTHGLIYKPTLDENKNAKWVYASKSNEVVIDIIEDKNNVYYNNNLLAIITDEDLVEEYKSKFKSAKNGNVQVRGAVVDGKKYGKKIQKLIKRKIYGITDSSLGEKSDWEFLTKYIILPKAKILNEKYAKEHLCLNYKDEKDNVKFGKKWPYDEEDIKASFSSKSFLDPYAISSKLYWAEFPFMINGKNRCSLFGSHIYYLQNEISDEKLRHFAKTYLLLSSMLSGIDNIEKFLFKSDEHSAISFLPTYYVAFIGALIWRKSLEKIEDDLYFGEFSDSSPSKDETLISKSEKMPYIDSQHKMDWYTLEDFYMKYEDIDIAVRNKLIKVFTDFANSDSVKKVLTACELKKDGKTAINDKEWKEVQKKWSSSQFKSEKPSSWAGIFGETMFNTYSYATQTTGYQGIRLLNNEDFVINKSMEDIIHLFGQFALIGRSTSERIGLGNPEVKVSKKQMTAYLNGFLSFIQDFNVNEIKNKAATSLANNTTYDRDIAIQTYYSLKHLWDTWLVTADEKDFTIENFFNKYFIFIDSFYTNIYHDIKINCENILNCYNNSKQNVLNFITGVTSQEGCMFLALPDFIDSNVNNDAELAKKEFSWKKEDLQQLFSPLPYNSMNETQPNNVFVFIYTQKFSNNASENTDVRFDSYMMNNTETWPDELNRDVFEEYGMYGHKTNDDIQSLHPNNSLSKTESPLVSSRYAYMMPCFGVTVNRGNNIIFKSINVSMDSPAITAVAAETLENIYTKAANDGSRRAYFHGQDIYSVYSQYSYSCEIEMMGCAQVQPLMYFQLLNIPMWRGTYMIYKVTHSLMPGNMTTKFVGMKMSRNRLPYATGYFTIAKKNHNVSASSTEVLIDSEWTTQTNGYPVGGKKMIENIFGNKGGYKFTSYFGVKRGNTQHNGLDVASKTGTPLYAPWDGYISLVRLNSETAGNYLCIVDSKKKSMVAYLHCDTIKVKQGDVVKFGDVVATLGNTGHSTGPHLHLELFINGKMNRYPKGKDYVDPLGLSSNGEPYYFTNGN